MRRRLLQLLLPVLLLPSLGGCTKFLGNLRRDLNDGETYTARSGRDDFGPSGPTMGGRFPESGFLEPDMPDAGYGASPELSVNHQERSPASTSGTPGVGGRDSWVAPEQADASRRDAYRQLEQEPADLGALGVSTASTPNLAPPVKRLYKNGSRATRADFMDDAQAEGSLWASDGQTNYYFVKNKIRGPGHIINVTIEPPLYKDIGTEMLRTLTNAERDQEVGLIQEKYRTKFLAEYEVKRKEEMDAIAASQAAPERAPAATPNTGPTAAPRPGATPSPSPSPSPSVSPSPTPTPTPKLTPLSDREIEDRMPKASIKDVDIYPLIEVKAGDVMMGEILERYPNGNYKIRAIKKVNYSRGASRLVTLIGVVKDADISEDDQIQSGKLYEYRVEAFHM